MIFDGPNRRIILQAIDGDAVEVIDVYSEWKRWVQSGAGALYPEAFTTVGGDDLGGGIFAGVYFFLNTAAGWRIRPREASHVLALSGNLYPLVSGDPMFANTLGVYTVQIQLTVSSLTQAISTTGGGGGGGGISIIDVQTAMTLQGYNTVRAQFLDQLDIDKQNSVPQTLAYLKEACAALEQALSRTIPLPYAAYAPRTTVGVNDDPPESGGDFGQAPPDYAIPVAPALGLPANYIFMPRQPLLGIRDGVNKEFRTAVPFVSGDAVREVVYRSGVRVPTTDYRVNTAAKTITFLRAPQPADTLFLDAYVETAS